MATNTVITKIKCGLLNVQSVGNKTFDIYNLIKDDGLDILLLTETWLTEYDTVKIQEMTPKTHTFLHAPRIDKRGGGVGIFFSKFCQKTRVYNTDKVDAFEHIQVSCEISGRKCIFVVVYRPPALSVNLFISEFRSYLELLDMTGANIFICGDFNLWIDNTNDYYVKEFIEMMKSFNLDNRVETPTSIGGHVLDLVFTDMSRDLVQDVSVENICRISPVHKLVNFIIPIVKVSRYRKKINFR